jgi:meso-butanediol dehydrogenase/(S,S)-butanediol dehydrogenase/diacetyl reductase
MQERELEWEAQLHGVSLEDVRAAWIRDTPMGRLEEP